MTTPTTNLTMTNIQTEFTGSNPISLSEYYRGGTYVPTNQATSATDGTPITAVGGGAIRMGMFRGITATPQYTPTLHSYTVAGTYTWVVPAGITSIDLLLVGGGGGSPLITAARTQAVRGGGGGGQVSRISSFTVTPGETLTLVVGAGGNGVGGSNSSVTRSSTGGGTLVVGGFVGGNSAGGASGSANSGGVGNGQIASGGGGGQGGAGGNASGSTPGVAGAGTTYTIGGTNLTLGVGGAGAVYTYDSKGTNGAPGTGNGGGGGARNTVLAQDPVVQVLASVGGSGGIYFVG